MEHYSIQKQYEVTLNNIKHIAKLRGIPLKEIASRAGLSESGLTKALRYNGMTLKTAIEICKILSCPIDFLVLPIEEAEDFFKASDNNNNNNQEINALTERVKDLQKLVLDIYKNTL